MADDPPGQSVDYVFEGCMEQAEVTALVADVLSRFQDIIPHFPDNCQALSFFLINSIDDYIERTFRGQDKSSFELRLPMLIAVDDLRSQDRLFNAMDQILHWFMIHWFKNLDREHLVVERRVDRSETNYNNRAVRREGGAEYIAVRFRMQGLSTQFGFGVYMVRQGLWQNDPGDDRIFLTFEILPLPDDAHAAGLSQDLLGALRSLHARVSALEGGARRFT